MDAVTFKTVFDIAETPFDWRMIALPGLGAIALVIFKFIGRKSVGDSRRNAIIGISFATVWTSLWSIGAVREVWTRYARQNDHFRVVEGRVAGFVPMPYEGHKEESLSVGGVRFHYSDGTLTSAFHNSRSHGGPLAPGVYVRIAYSGNDILRLEIADGK